MSDENFFNELEDDIQHEQWLDFWRRYGFYIGALAVLTLISSGLYLWWSHQQEKLLLESAATYDRAVRHLDALETPKAEKLFKDLVAHGKGGYPFLAQVRLTSLGSQKAQTLHEEKLAREALHHYELLEKEAPAYGLGMKDLVIFSRASLILNTSKNPQGKLRNLSVYRLPGRPWAPLSVMLQAMALSQEGKKDDAIQLIGDFLKKARRPSMFDFYLELLRVGLGAGTISPHFLKEST